jgi:hypothetical protein
MAVYARAPLRSASPRPAAAHARRRRAAAQQLFAALRGLTTPARG